MTTRQIGVLFGLALIWGGSFLFIRVLVDGGVGPPGVAAGRCTFGLIALVPFIIAARSSLPRDRRTIAGLFALGTINMTIPWILFATAEQRVPSSVASVANSGSPLWTALFASVFLPGDTLSRGQRVGLFLGFAGIVVLSADGLSGFDRESLIGTGLIAIATFCYGASAVAIRRSFGAVAPVALASMQLASACVVLWPLALLTGAFAGASMGLPEWGSVITLGALGSGVAMVGYVWLIGNAGAVRASVVTYVIPPVGVFLGWVVLGEHIGWNLLGGLVFVIAGVAMVQGWGLHRLAWRIAAGVRRTAPAEATADLSAPE